MEEKDSINEMVDWVRSKKDTLKNLTVDDETVLRYRRLMAERGYECTPKEVKAYILIIKSILEN